ncbi:YfcE family phosphodiesterase [Siphonobacter sp. BAB-5405]|uniref:metallophosphoesterase family protein n=1 Tax=Siphonobacter sp. BAB-5405 TaxID=1864825 RepID=UPI000C803928|nr:metallophosphoesterase family protein [Siphonobacter sp. BAB-5405]PMD99174.1 YfcE family phosphodiesterase [Siphonobacter sp. BAB-5405]
MKKILLFSDTHGWFDEALDSHCRWADEIWHAGDWGTGVYERLQMYARPIQGVYGNIDGTTIRSLFPLINHFTCEGVNVGITHIAGTPGRYKPDARQLLREQKPDVLICGHSHILRVERDSSGILFMNPGAAGKEGFHRIMTALRFKVDQGRIFDVEVVELGKRGKIPDNFSV